MGKGSQRKRWGEIEERHMLTEGAQKQRYGEMEMGERHKDRDESEGMDIVMTGASAPCYMPLKLPVRVLLDSASFQRDRPLPVPSVPRRQPRAQKLHLQCTPYCPTRSFQPPQSTPVLDWPAS